MFILSTIAKTGIWPTQHRDIEEIFRKYYIEIIVIVFFLTILEFWN